MNKRTMGRRATAAAIALALGTLAGLAQAQAFPARPIKLVVPFAAGGGTDILARDIAPRIGELLGQPVVIENRGGAGGNIGADAVAKAPADGYTILMGSNTLSINPALYRGQAPDPVRSYTPIGSIAFAPMVLVTNADYPVRTVAELIAKAKSTAGGLNWATPGNGTPHHLAEELFNSMTGANLVMLQYKGGGPAINDLLGKQTQASFLTYSSVKGFIDSGKLRAIAVAAGTRSKLLPEVPTVAEAGVPGYKAELWYGLFAPAGTPAPVVQALNAALNRVLADKAVQQRLTEQGYDTVAGTPAQLADLLRDDLARSAKLIADTGIRAE